MKIAIMGGAFDPPHHGHINLVKSICERIKPDKTLIIPTGNAPHKTTQTPFETRFRLAQAAFPEYEVSDIENCSYLSYTVNTLEKLHKFYPNSEFHLIVGADMYQSMDTWKDSERVRELCTVQAGERCVMSSSLIRGKLSAKRYTHSINVAIMCSELSKSHKLSAEMSQKTYIAGILHDITKHSDIAPDSHEFSPSAAEIAEPKLWHAVTGAKFVRDELGISDCDIVNAIRYHTVGRENMSVIEKIVYIADKISAERDYDGVSELRRLAFCDLDSAIAAENSYKSERLRRLKNARA
jgi:nicotinate-nucleotide adenylyltransferase